MDLRNRAKARASMLGYEHPTAAIAAAYGVASDDNRVRALWQVIATGRPAYDKVVELCTVFRFALADAGVWFTDDEDAIRTMLASKPEGDR